MGDLQKNNTYENQTENYLYDFSEIIATITNDQANNNQPNLATKAALEKFRNGYLTMASNKLMLQNMSMVLEILSEQSIKWSQQQLNLFRSEVICYIQQCMSSYYIDTPSIDNSVNKVEEPLLQLAPVTISGLPSRNLNQTVKSHQLIIEQFIALGFYKGDRNNIRFSEGLKLTGQSSIIFTGEISFDDLSKIANEMTNRGIKSEACNSAIAKSIKIHMLADDFERVLRNKTEAVNAVKQAAYKKLQQFRNS